MRRTLSYKNALISEILVPGVREGTDVVWLWVNVISRGWNTSEVVRTTTINFIWALVSPWLLSH